jgi:mTERF domain-containing protein
MYSLILHGKRLVQLKKCRHLSVPVNLLEKASPFSNSFSYANATDASLRAGRKGLSFSVSYLVDSLGLPKKVAESISKKVSFEDKGNPDSVLSLLRSHGFTDSQISSIITDYPQLLVADAEKSIGPKLQFLQSRGASRSELTHIVSTVPEILGKRGDKTISIYYDFVKEIIEADKSSKFEKLCHSLPEGSKQENKIRNVLVLRELGVPQRLLFPLLISDHQPVCGKENFEESLKKVVEMGFDPTTSKFVKALRVVYRFRDKTIEAKVNVCKSLGFSVGDVWAMFKKCPSFLNFSENKIVQTWETLKKCGLLEADVRSVW